MTISKRLGHGILLWLVVFAAAMALYPIRMNEPIFFETLIGIWLVFATVCFSVWYFGKYPEESEFYRALRLGFIWLAVNLVFDLVLFLWGPMAMPFKNYLKDIGLTYVMIPVITGGFGWLVKKP